MDYFNNMVIMKQEREEVEIKEEELQVNHDPLFLDEREGILTHGGKSPPSPSSSRNFYGPKKQWQIEEKNELQNRVTVTQLCSTSCVPFVITSRKPTSYAASDVTPRKARKDLNMTESTGSAQNHQKHEQEKESVTNCIKTEIDTQSKKMVMSVHDFFRSRNQLLSETDLKIKVAAATGVSVSSVDRTKKDFKDGRIDSPPFRKRYAPVLDTVDDFASGCIRRDLLSYYEIGEIPTSNTLRKVLEKSSIKFQGCMTSFYNLTKKIGFQCKKLGGRHILMEREDIAASRCKYLRILNEKRSISNPHSEVYVGETWVSQKDLLDTVRSKSKTVRDPPYIIVHAGNKQGFIPGSLLMLKSKCRRNENFLSPLTPKHFRAWFEDQLLPNIPNNSLIIVSSSSSNSQFDVKVPSRIMKKSDIIHWLVENSIAHDASVSKAELLHLANSNKEKYVYEIDEIAHGKGHEVLRLPRYHSHLNPMELIWDNVKSVIKKELANSDENLRNLIKDAIAKISAEDWKMHTETITQMEEEYRNKENAVDHQLESLAINLDEATTDEED